MVKNIKLSKYILVFSLLITKNCFSGNPDTTLSCIGASKVQSAYLKILFKQKKFLTNNTNSDTLEIWYVKDNNRKNAYIKFVAKSQKSKVYFKIDTISALFGQHRKLGKEEQENYLSDFFVFEVISFDRARSHFVKTEIPSSLKITCSENKKGKQLFIEKKDKTNFDSVLCQLTYDFRFDKNENVNFLKNVVQLFNDSQIQELSIIQSNYIYDADNTNIKSYIMEQYLEQLKVNGTKQVAENNTSGNSNQITNSQKMLNIDLYSLNSDNKKSKLSDIIENYALVKLTYNSCAPCILAIPAFERLNEVWNKKLQVFNINVVNSNDEIVQFIKKQKVKSKIYFNPDLINQLKNINSSYPTFLILNKSLEILYVYQGYDVNLEKDINRQLEKLFR